MIYNDNCLQGMKQQSDNSIDCCITDPPYGMSFMGKDWDNAIPSVDIFKEIYRVLKDGSFLFCFSIPRTDCLWRMMEVIEKAGFKVNMSPIYHTFASGFPKAHNVSKGIDKRGETKASEHFDGWYSYQPKPAVEVIIVAQKPMKHKTYVDNALAYYDGENINAGCVNIDATRIPFESEDRKEYEKKRDSFNNQAHKKYNNAVKMFDSKLFESSKMKELSIKGRFPANLLVQDDVLWDGKIRQGRWGKNSDGKEYLGRGKNSTYQSIKDSGSYSRYFDLDKWAVSKGVKDTFPFMIVPKASKSEKNKGCDGLEEKEMFGDYQDASKMGWANADSPNRKGRINKRKNNHPTVKPIKLITYLLTLATRENDTILDCFMGSGTTGVASIQENRKFIGYELNAEYFDIAKARIDNAEKENRDLFNA